MRFAIAAVVGIGVITFALYIAAARNLDDQLVLMVDLDHLDQHRPLLVARASSGSAETDVAAYLFGDKSSEAALDSLAQAISSGAAWSLSGSDVSIRVDLRHVESALTARLVMTDDKNERERLVEVVRALQRLQQDSERAPDSSASGVARGGSHAPSRAVADQLPKVSDDQADRQSMRTANEDVAGAPSATEANAFALLRSNVIEKPDVLLARATIATFYLLVTVLGIYMGVIYEALGRFDPRKNVKFRHLLRHATTASAWQGLFASPIVFATVLVLVPRNEISAVMALFAFQNGFFWRATLQRLVEARASRTPAGEPAPSSS